MIIRVSDDEWINDRWINRACKTEYESGETEIYIELSTEEGSPFRYDATRGGQRWVKGEHAAALIKQWGKVNHD